MTKQRAVTCILLVVALSIPLYADPGQIRCGTKQLTDAEITALEKQIERGKKGKVSTVIPVWFHVISGGAGFANGETPDFMIRNQVRVLNDSYNGKTGGANTGFGFELAGITRTENATWF